MHTFQSVLITGASSGIGAVLARLLAPKVSRLILSGRRQTALEGVKQGLPGEVRLVQADLADEAGRKKLLACIREEKPDLVINNAGFGLYGDTLSHSTKALSDILVVNAQAVLEITTEAARGLIEQGRSGIICNVSSVAAFMVMPGNGVYAASKAFVNQFSEGLDFETRPHGVRVLAACPGQVSTAFSARASGLCSDEPSELAYSMSPQFAAEQIWEQICSQKGVRIFDWRYRWGLFLYNYLVPRRWIQSWLYGSLTKRKKINGHV